MYILLLVAFLPAFFLLKYIYNKDTVEKEPKGLLVKCFAIGVATVFPAAILEIIIGKPIDFLFINSKLYYVITCFAGIALVEEGVKFIGLKLITWKDKEFNYIFDAVVYSVFVSLGFAAFENLFYIISDGSINFTTALMRAISAVPAHFFFSIYMGLFYGMYKWKSVKGEKCGIYKFYAILVPTLVHGVYDYLLYMAQIESIYVIVWIIILIGLYIYTFIKIKKMSLSDVPLFSVYNNEALVNNESPNINRYNNHNTYCTKCGRPMVGVFCSHCGYKIE